MSDEQERDAAIVEKRRASWVFTMELNKRENIPDSVMTEDAQLVVALYRTIDRLTAERDQAREQLAKLRGILATLLDMFGTPATRQTEVNLAMALSVYEAEGMKEESHVLRATIEAINAVLGIESEAGE